MNTIRIPSWLRVVFVFLLLFAFLVGITLLSGSIKSLGKGVMDSYMAGVSNPLTGLIVGILATTLVQSSSVTPSLIVGMVASGTLQVQFAIPMIMGANIGTTVTSTIAALGHSGHRVEFRRAFAAATCHDFFNYMAVLVLLPLEVMTGVFEKSSAALANAFVGVSSSGKINSPIKSALKGSAKAIAKLVKPHIDDPSVANGVLAVIGFTMIMVALMLIVKTMRGLMLDRMRGFLSRTVGRSAALAISVGAVLTVLVQSSSITTAVFVPLAGAGLVRVSQVFPMVLGANVGTTVTALIAAFAISGEESTASLQIALVHLLFNLVAIIGIYWIPGVKRIPVLAAYRLARIASRSRALALTYMISAFYALPALLFFAFR